MKCGFQQTPFYSSTKKSHSLQINTVKLSQKKSVCPQSENMRNKKVLLKASHLQISHYNNDSGNFQIPSVCPLPNFGDGKLYSCTGILSRKKRSTYKIASVIKINSTLKSSKSSK